MEKPLLPKLVVAVFYFGKLQRNIYVEPAVAKCNPKQLDNIIFFSLYFIRQNKRMSILTYNKFDVFQGTCHETNIRWICASQSRHWSRRFYPKDVDDFRSGYRNDPTNDMVTYSLEGLQAEHAQELARLGLQSLMEDREIELAEALDEIAQAIARQTDGLPFYINHTVDRLADLYRQLKRPITVAEVEKAVDSLIMDPEDKVHFGHYDERIAVYYRFDPKAVELARIVLNILCRTEQPMSEDRVWDAAAAQTPLTDKNFFQRTLALLVKDHYLQRHLFEEKRVYQFKYNLIRNWWLKNRA